LRLCAGSRLSTLPRVVRSINTAAESFFESLTEELAHDMVFFSRDIPRARIREYVETFYNRQRWHSAINYAVPAYYELANSPSIAA